VVKGSCCLCHPVTEAERIVDQVFLLLIFLAVALGVMAGYFVVVDLVRRDERLASRRVQSLREGETRGADEPPLFKDVCEIDPGKFDHSRPAPRAIDWVKAGAAPLRDWLGSLRRSLERSALKVRFSQVLTASAALAVVLGAAAWWAQGPLLALLATCGGAAGPFAFVEMKARSRRERFLAQLSGALELMACVIRSRQSVPQAFQAVADSFEEPIAGAFARCREQQNMGLPPEAAFQDLAEQSGVLEMRIFAMAMLVQRQAGGNLSELLERLAGLVRERRRIRQTIRTLTAEGRLQAAVLLVLPFVMFAAMRFVNRDYADELLRHTRLLFATAALMGIGAWWIQRIVRIDV
jgi:tight adherence protein B